MRGHKNKHPSPPLPDLRRNVVQEVLRTPFAALSVLRRKLACAQRNTRRMLWIPRRDPEPSQQSIARWYFWPYMKQDAQRTLVQGIKKRLDKAGDNWVKELTNMLCSYRTTHTGSIGECLFTLVYGTEAIIQAELGIPSHRILHFNEESNSQLLKEHRDLVDKLRETTFI
ncbi:UNVERIFIED_CONTAM: hypothetical protein Scaly_2788900 [Sesamum calycinum]|uniref:Uncharacterized protein n=1 Tax=Sesamum calycinum TaxID=2727403 RepID=A0AAW2IWE7_9LAMI